MKKIKRVAYGCDMNKLRPFLSEDFKELGGLFWWERDVSINFALNDLDLTVRFLYVLRYKAEAEAYRFYVIADTRYNDTRYNDIHRLKKLYSDDTVLVEPKEFLSLVQKFRVINKLNGVQ